MKVVDNEISGGNGSKTKNGPTKTGYATGYNYEETNTPVKATGTIAKTTYNPKTGYYNAGQSVPLNSRQITKEEFDNATNDNYQDAYNNTLAQAGIGFIKGLLNGLSFSPVATNRASEINNMIKVEPLSRKINAVNSKIAVPVGNTPTKEDEYLKAFYNVYK